MKDFLVGTAVLGGIIGVLLLISTISSTPPVATPAPTPAKNYITCYINGIKITGLRTCEEMKDFYKKTCSMIADPNNDQNCEDFKDHEDAQWMYEQTIICWNMDIYDLDRDHDGVACESLPNNQE